MTRGVNQLILVGYTTQAPEIRYTSDGRAIANITIATNEEWKDKVTGEKKNKAEYHRVVIFGKLAEITGEYVKKGDLLYVCGSLQPRKWQDQNGLDRYTAKVIVNIGETLQMLGGRDRENISTASTVNWEQPSHTQTVPVNRPANVQPMNVPPMDFSEDIPF